MKKIFIIVFLFLLAGCSSNYNLEISNDSFKENIQIYIDKDQIPTKTEDGIELDDPITPFLNEKTSALSSNEKSYYKKKVIDLDEQIQVNMSYKYTAKKFSDSNSLKLCFDNYEFKYEDSYYIHAYGTFFCLNSGDMNINIKTNNKVIKNNADKVDGNVYTWNINMDNVDNVNIEFEVEKGFPYKTMTYGIIAVVGILVIIVIIYLIYKRQKKANQI